MGCNPWGRKESDTAERLNTSPLPGCSEGQKSFTWSPGKLTSPMDGGSQVGARIQLVWAGVRWWTGAQKPGASAVGSVLGWLRTPLVLFGGMMEPIVVRQLLASTRPAST